MSQKRTLARGLAPSAGATLTVETTNVSDHRMFLNRSAANLPVVNASRGATKNPLDYHSTSTIRAVDEAAARSHVHNENRGMAR